MKAEPPTPRRRTLNSLAGRIDLACDRLEKVRKPGKPVEIKDFLREFSTEERTAAFRELLALELELLSDELYTADIADFLARYLEFEETVLEVFLGTENNSVALTLAFSEFFPWESPRSLPEPLERLQQLASPCNYESGEFLIRQGDAAESLMMVLEGIVRVSLVDDQGLTHELGTIGKGQILGEMALLTNEPRTASAVAVGQVRVAVLSVAEFHALAYDCPHLASLLTEVMAERLGSHACDALTDKQLDRYRIRKRLGRGGMSIVYEALEIQTEQRVALKMMNHKLIYSPSALEQFQLEATLIERFDHPHIVKTLRCFPAFHTYFIAMEYCEGQTLTDFLLCEGPLGEVDFRSALGQLASALQYAHQQGVIHRDVKPSNVMREPSGTLKLMDFGLAEPLLPGSVGDSVLSGTPRYMAPEQRTLQPLDQRADYFALGCVAYELLTAKPLFTRSSSQELKRDFSQWTAPDFRRLATDSLAGQLLSAETGYRVQQLLAVAPADRGQSIDDIARWCSME